MIIIALLVGFNPLVIGSSVLMSVRNLPQGLMITSFNPLVIGSSVLILRKVAVGTA